MERASHSKRLMRDCVQRLHRYLPTHVVDMDNDLIGQRGVRYKGTTSAKEVRCVLLLPFRISRRRSSG